MKLYDGKVKIGIVGCGAIGSRIAKSICKELRKFCYVSGLYDIDQKKTRRLEKNLKLKKVATDALTPLIKNCDCLVEAVNAESTREIIEQALQSQKSVLAMSVGKLLKAPDLFDLARKNKCALLLPSGAIAGLDAIKAASLVHVDKITLITRKPPVSFQNNPYLKKNRIDLTKIKEETLLFRGDVQSAVKWFPQNINVAATLFFASQLKRNITIEIYTCPDYKMNSHEIEMIGDFGRLFTRTDNIVCPDNPKTSYLAVLSGIQTLKQYCTGILIGT